MWPQLPPTKRLSARSSRRLPDLPVHLLIAGSDAPDSYREKSKQLGIAERCRWESPRQDVMDLYAAADVYVSPSLEDSFGLPVAEAMACGLSAITSACAGVSEIVRDGADGFVLREPADAQALAQLLRRLHADAEMRRRVGEAAAKAARSWDWDRNADEVWTLLRETRARKYSVADAEGKP